MGRTKQFPLNDDDRARINVDMQQSIDKIAKYEKEIRPFKKCLVEGGASYLDYKKYVEHEIEKRRRRISMHKSMIRKYEWMLKAGVNLVGFWR